MNFTLYDTLNKLWHISEYMIYLIHIYVFCTNQYCTDYQWPFQQKVHLDHGIVKDDIAEKCVIFDKSVYKVKKTLCKNDTFSRFCHALAYPGCHLLYVNYANKGGGGAGWLGNFCNSLFFETFFTPLDFAKNSQRHLCVSILIYCFILNKKAYWYSYHLYLTNFQLYQRHLQLTFFYKFQLV